MFVDLAINPPVGLAWWWNALAAIMLLGGVAVLTWGIVIWRRSRKPSMSSEDSLETLRSKVLAELEVIAADHRAGTLPAAQAAVRTSNLVRHFLGLAAETDADYATAHQIAMLARIRPSLQPAARLIADLQPIAYGGSLDDCERLIVEAQEVVRTWQ